MGVEGTTTFDIYYRPTQSYDYLNNDEKTKKLLDILRGCIKHNYFESLSIKKEEALVWKRDVEPYVCILSFTFDNRNGLASDYIQKKLNESFDGDYMKALQCVVVRRDDIFMDCVSQYRTAYAPSGEKVFSEEDHILALTDEQAKDQSYAEEGYFFDSEHNTWHENPDFGKTSILHYVAKELFAVEIVENDLSPGKYEFKEDWNPAKVQKPKEDHLKESWKKAVQELDPK